MKIALIILEALCIILGNALLCVVFIYAVIALEAGRYDEVTARMLICLSLQFEGYGRGTNERAPHPIQRPDGQGHP